MPHLPSTCEVGAETPSWPGGFGEDRLPFQRGLGRTAYHSSGVWGGLLAIPAGFGEDCRPFQHQRGRVKTAEDPTTAWNLCKQARAPHEEQTQLGVDRGVWRSQKEDVCSQCWSDRAGRDCTQLTGVMTVSTRPPKDQASQKSGGGKDEVPPLPEENGNGWLSVGAVPRVPLSHLSRPQATFY